MNLLARSRATPRAFLHLLVTPERPRKNHFARPVTQQAQPGRTSEKKAPHRGFLVIFFLACFARLQLIFERVRKTKRIGMLEGSGQLRRSIAAEFGEFCFVDLAVLSGFADFLDLEDVTVSNRQQQLARREMFLCR